MAILAAPRRQRFGKLRTLLRRPGVVAAGAAACGLAGWAATGDVVLAAIATGAGAAWSALAYALGRQHGNGGGPPPSRDKAVEEIEQMLAQLPEPRQETRWLRWHDRAVQLRRIVMLERLILDHLPKT